MKSSTENERAKSRNEARLKGEAFLEVGNTAMAFKMFTIAVDITPEMAYMFV